MAAICRSTIIKEGTPFTSEWSLRSLRNSHAVYVGIYIPFISEWLRRSAGICSLNRQFRQSTKNKPSFTNDDSLRRMLYLASQRIVKHWHARCQNWDLVLSQLEIMFADRAIG